MCENLYRGYEYRPRPRFFHTDRLSSVNKMFIMWQTRKISFVLCNWFVVTDSFLANGDELSLILSKFTRPRYVLLLSPFGAFIRDIVR